MCIKSGDEIRGRLIDKVI